MPTYSYEGISTAGKNVKGTQEAPSRQALIADLVEKGIFVSKAEEVTTGKGRFDALLAQFSSKKHLTDIFFQLSLLLRSGIPLVEAIRILAETTHSKAYKNAMLDVVARVAEGVRFSDALRKYPRQFDPMYVNLIRASEQVGRLAPVLMDIAVYEEDKKKAVDKVTAALIYPLTVLILGLGVLGFLISYVVPKMQNIFTSVRQDIPGSTRFLMSLADYLKNYGTLTFLFFLLCIAGARYVYVKNENFRMKVDKRLFRSAFVSQVAIAKLSHVLAFQLKEGLPLVDALAHATETVWNRYLYSVLKKVREDVQGGRKFSESVRSTGIFPELFPAAVATGEKSGNMPELLERVSEFYNKKVETFTQSFISVIEPLFIVVIGLMVGFIVISIMEPLFQMNTLVK